MKRKILRSIARLNMKKAGVKHINKRKAEEHNRSYFARHWREYL